MIRRILFIFLLFIIASISFVEAMQWLVKFDIGVSSEMLNLGIFVIALIALFILTGGSRKNDSQYKTIIKDDKDSLMITENAIIQLVKHALGKIPAILDSDIRVGYGKEKKIRLKIAMTLTADSKIADISTLVEQYVHESFAATLDEKVEKIEVTIKGFKESKGQIS